MSVCRSLSIWTLNTRQTTAGTGRRRCSARGQSHRPSRRTRGRCCWTSNKTSPTWRGRSPIAENWANGSRTTKTTAERKSQEVEVGRPKKGCSGTARLVRTRMLAEETIGKGKSLLPPLLPSLYGREYEK